MSPDGVTKVRRWRYVVPVVFVFAGVLFAASAHTSHGIDLRVTGRDDLTSLVMREQQTVAGQNHQLADLERKVQAATSTAAKRDGRVADVRAQGEAVADQAGLVPVKGPAVSVSLDDAPPLPGNEQGSVPPDYLVVHQQDVQAVVNALCVGNTLLLQGVVYSPPYVVAAIGDPARLRAALDAAPDIVIYKQYVDAYKLGYVVKSEPQVTMPAYTGAVALQHATPLTGTAS
jgi:uncharacterized protein YlxW (UPF0749 family)